ncbi:MAG: ZIP family metal transporter [Zoogloeaceae bacterium]|nr:ZIP family metal transporter [Zoogloeaceae bacterium]
MEFLPLQIAAACAVGGIISVLLAAFVCERLHGNDPKRLSWMIAYAIGALLGAAFLDTLPEALEQADAHAVSATVLAGILVFFLLEKFVLWRHCHAEGCPGHEPEGHRHAPGVLVLVGDTFHNFVDGVMIAAAFLADPHLGWVMALAIAAHEIPQEMGDYLVLRHSGFSRARALFWNAVSGVAMIVGGLLTWAAKEVIEGVVGYFLAVGASSMLYIALSDLLPGLHQKNTLPDSTRQIAGIALGITSIVAVSLLFAHGH